jgi:hypothetical protein
VQLNPVGKLELGRLAAHGFSLEHQYQAVELLEKQQAIKVCFLPWA